MSGQRIRVMHVIARMNVGGPAVEISELMRGLDSDRFDQCLVTGWCADDEADFLLTQAPDVPALRIDGLGRSIRPTDDALVLARLRSRVRAFRPHIVHTHTAKAGVLGRIAGRTAGVGARIVHTHHGHLLHGYFGPAKTRAVVLTERELSRITDRIITVGTQVRDDLLEAGIGRAEQYTVIHSGVRIGPLPPREQARVELGVAGGGVVVSMIGRLTAIKRPDRFAAVVADSVRRGLDAQYLVAGSGDQEAPLRARVERDRLPVQMLGWRSDLERILAATDIVLLTSDNEGTPLSLVQAGLAGVPAVATRVGSVPEVVQDRVTGLLCDRDPRSLASAVEELATQGDLRRGLGDHARQKAHNEFGLVGFLAQHARLYEALT